MRGQGLAEGIECIRTEQPGKTKLAIFLPGFSRIANPYPGPTGEVAVHVSKETKAVQFVILEKAMPTRDDAWSLLCEYTQNESLRKHALAVEACVRAYARKTGADEDLWSLTALLHDFDYERWPNDAHSPTEEHPAGGSAILRERGYPEEMIRAIVSHADYCKVPRETPLEHTLFACDELAGFLTACSLVKPSKSIFEVEPDSVKRKLKDKAFARGVNRDDVRKGAEELAVPIEEHIAFCIAAMREAADALGLRGNQAAGA
jgi:putative nucleotidyltransferase with HDIG domain